MKRSNRTMQAHIPTPKLRIKVKKLYDNNVEETFTTDNILEYSKIEDVGPPSGELAASYVSLNEQQILNYENTDNYQFPYISRPLLDNVEEVLINDDESLANDEPLFDTIDEVLLDDYESNVSDIEEGLDNSVLEEGSFDFEGFSDIITNIRQIRKWRNRLPLAKVNEHSVPLSKYRTPSTYESTKKAFTISPLIHLERILNNPILMPKMYFGPGVVTDEKQEFWHGELWQDSLMFGEHKIKKDNEAGDFLICYEQSSTFICRVRGIVVDEINNNSLKLKVDQIISHDDLPNCHLTDNRHTRGNGNELWLVEGKTNLVNPENIAQRIIVWMCDMPEPEVYDFYIKEIIYRFNNRWKFRDITMRHQLPCEYITLTPPPQHLPVLKIFLDIYVDDFGTYRNVYHSLGGVYIQLGNMPLTLRKQLKNHFLIGFVPFGAKFNDFIEPVLQDIKRLEKGLIMQTLNGNAFVIGSIGCVTADLPQGNDIADVKRHNAKYGCRSCNVPNDQYTNIDYNYIKNARFHQQTEKQFIEIKSQHSKIDRERLATKYGLLIEPGPFKMLKWDRHLQIPQDPYHSMAGKARTLLEGTFNIFNTNGENAFIEYWKNIEKPSHWYRMPNPVRYRQSFMFSDVLRLTMLMPFVLRRFLKPYHIKKEVLNNWNMEQNIKQNSAVLKLCTCWAIEAKVLKLAFSNTMTESVYQELQELLKREYEILIQLFSDNFTNLPNLHVNVHLLQHARNFATLLNTAVGVKEMVHRIFKKMVPHMNCKVIELDLTKRYNTLQALRHLIDGWTDPRFSTRTNALNNINTDPILRTIFSGWYATESLSITINNQKNVEDERDDSITVCHDENFIDISFSNKWNNKKVRSMGLSKKLDADHPFFRDLYEAYTGFLDSKATLLNKNLEFYGSITYTVIKSNQDNIQIKLRVGDVVELCEESEGIAYAKMASIFRHQANNGKYYAFFSFNWFQATNTMDPVLECPFYNIQKPEESRWFQIFPINFINHIPYVHFVHNCTNLCNVEHDETNRGYILNKFYYNAV
uniref:BAH domain-containing protein n=1 Tax=Rhizophagus irregularis (strain DAOM 181602 / DAOM 197198 / MUCL 43194) TaxID=747089 RepID=U9UVI7_RHIID